MLPKSLQPHPRHRQVPQELLPSDQNQIQWVPVIRCITSCGKAMQSVRCCKVYNCPWWVAEICFGYNFFPPNLHSLLLCEEKEAVQASSRRGDSRGRPSQAGTSEEEEESHLCAEEETFLCCWLHSCRLTAGQIALLSVFPLILHEELSSVCNGKIHGLCPKSFATPYIFHYIGGCAVQICIGNPKPDILHCIQCIVKCNTNKI